VDNLIAQLQPIFRDVLDTPGLLLTRQSSALNVDGWDSLAHINLISAIEQQFGIRFALGELEELKNVGEMMDLMEQKFAKR
jgi:acyl carrier protein